MAGALDYGAAVASLERALTFGIHPSLDGIRALSARMGEPQSTFASVQVTGTNGKTSVTRLISELLRAHGRRTGAYTSPHLVSYTERMAVDGVPISEQDFARAVGVAVDAAAECGGIDAFTEFELLTASALWAFREAGVDWACLEVGMGGRWDATSVVSPRVSVITGVALDHTDRLGTTREAIAADKAHIIKPGSTAVIGPGCRGVEDVLLERARSVGVPVVRVGLADADVTWRVLSAPERPGQTMRLAVSTPRAEYPMLTVPAPSYQAPNVAVAVAAAEAALGERLDDESATRALGAMTFPGRFQVLRSSPPLVIDGAHNPEAAAVLASAVRESFGDRKPVFVLGAMADKDVTGIVSALLEVSAGFVCTASRSARALPPGDLARVVDAAGGRVLAVEDDVVAALARALELAPDGVVAAGSIYVAGEALSALDARR